VVTNTIRIEHCGTISVGFSKEPFVTKKSAGVIAQFEHMKLEGPCLDAMSIGMVGGIFVKFSHMPLFQ
jgi:hypothetical protein